MSEPDIAICMPYFEHWECLKNALDSYQFHGYHDPDQMGGLTVALCICDDGSMKQPIIPAAVSSIAPFDDIRVCTLPPKEDWRCPSVTRNRAAAMSDSRLIYMTQPDMVHHDPVLLRMAQAIKGPNDIAKSYVRQNEAYRTRGPWCNKGWHSHPMYRPINYSPSYMMAREFYYRCGGYDEGMRDLGYGGEDLDFAFTWDTHGAEYHWIDGTVEHQWHHRIWVGKRKDLTTSQTAKDYFKEKWGIEPQEYFRQMKGRTRPCPTR
ncbi:MAG: hypothetical protein ACYTEQ_27530 [Planctomycetota bacterium]|jgi:hypothetical protein